MKCNLKRNVVTSRSYYTCALKPHLKELPTAHQIEINQFLPVVFKELPLDLTWLIHASLSFRLFLVLVLGSKERQPIRATSYWQRTENVRKLKYFFPGRQTSTKTNQNDESFKNILSCIKTIFKKIRFKKETRSKDMRLYI